MGNSLNDSPEQKLNNGLKAIALRVFGTRDGVTPIFPKSGEHIQEAMKQAYELGRSEAFSGRP